MSAFKINKRQDFFSSNNGNGLDYPSGTYTAHKIPASNKRATEEKHEPISSKNEIGFVNLLEQIYARSVKRGFSLNLMITGTSSLGKSTFVNSLLMTDFYNADLQSASTRYNEGKSFGPVESHTVYVNESKVNLRMSILDTPGFGDHVDNSYCFLPLVEEIENRFNQYMKQELRVDRVTLTNGSSEFTALQFPNDQRIHACLYFLQPISQGLTAFDIEAMRCLHKRVNLVPIIAKADTLTPEECRHAKALILRQLAEHEISVYRFEASPSAGDSSSTNAELAKYRQRFPFAIVTSNSLVTKADGTKVRGRHYPWGVVETDSLEHNDFQALKTLLVNAHLHDLINETHFRHYADFRERQLEAIKLGTRLPDEDADDPEGCGPLYQLEIERREHQVKLGQLEREMEAVFEQKVRERAQKFQEREQEFERQTARLLDKVDEEMRQLEQQERQFQLERAEWESANKEILMLVCSSTMNKLDEKEKSKTKRLGLF